MVQNSQRKVLRAAGEVDREIDQLAEVVDFSNKLQSKNELSIYRKLSIEAVYPPLRQTGCYLPVFILLIIQGLFLLILFLSSLLLL